MIIIPRKTSKKSKIKEYRNFKIGDRVVIHGLYYDSLDYNGKIGVIIEEKVCRCTRNHKKIDLGMYVVKLDNPKGCVFETPMIDNNDLTLFGSD